MSIQHFRVILLLAITAALLHVTFQQNLVSLFPLPIILSTALIWLAAAPGYYVLCLIIIGELFGILPPGFMTAIVLTPLAFSRLRQQTQIDLSFTFVLTIAMTVTTQLLLLCIGTLWSPLLGVATWSQVLIILPWPLLATMFAINTIAIVALCLIGDAFAPRTKQGSSLFDWEPSIPRGKPRGGRRYTMMRRRPPLSQQTSPGAARVRHPPTGGGGTPRSLARGLTGGLVYYHRYGQSAAR